ncbi:response regulator [Emticicia sp. C21]|uniref:response regulator n=1 Tax=Emticicia sp. C21 TaxID=2302915 RepID=UPI000E34AF68|nr:response regulator [Emticicia sp. C21]RFS15163.1 response regulator [Emticicia sp. C21]
MIQKLLCIDDDETTLLLIRVVVQKALFAKEVVTCLSGNEALSYYHNLSNVTDTKISDAPQLVFLDLNMPMMNGWEFLDEFIETYYPKFGHTKVVILSSSTNPADKERVKKYPMIIGYISKPLTVDLLKKLIG